MKRIFLVLFAALLFAGSAAAQDPSQIPAVPNDPAVKVGKLDNGLTYYIRKNDKPAQRAEFYLATNVGAIQEEQPAQDGLAHFLEHMCFNGTANFPDKGILDYLRSIGAEFGRNINASTGVEETQYMLNNIPVARESVVDSCLMILRDYAHFVTNADEEIDKERGVIIEERRTRRTADWRMHEQSLPYYYAGTKYAECTLIGLQEHLETFKPESLRSFYETWYHPGNQAVVVVGDIDVDRTEAKIKELFGIIPKKENPKAKEVIMIPGNKEPVAGIITDKEATAPSIEMLWKKDAMPEAYNSTIVGKAQELLKNLIQSIMYERFTDLTAKPDCPYLSGFFGIFNFTETCEPALAEVTLKEGDLLGGFKAFYTEIEKMKRYGFSDDEIERAKTNLLNRYDDRRKKAETRKNPEFIRPILQNFFDNYSYPDPETDYAIVDQLLKQIPGAALNQVAGTLITDENLVVLYKGPEKDGLATPTADDLLKVIAEVKASDIKANAATEVAKDFLDASKLKGAKVKKTALTAYKATEWTLANGVKVVVYPTDYTKDQILINIYEQGGKSLIETADLPSFDENVFMLYLRNTGIADFPGTQVSKMLTGKTLHIDPYIDDLKHGVSGSTSVKDLETALQLAYLYYTAPRFDAEEFQNGIEQIKAVLPNLMEQPNFKFGQILYDTMYGGNPRKAQITPEILAKADVKTLERVYKSLFNDAAGVTAVFVGDINPETLKPLVEKYLGSLKKGKKASAWTDRHEDIVKGAVEKVAPLKMQTPKSTVCNIYSTGLKYSAANEVALDAAKYILDIRYVNSLREDEGGTYGAGVGTDLRKDPTDRALIQVYFDCKPALTEKLRALAKQGIEDLAANGPTEEEISAAKLNLEKKVPESRIRNNYWEDCLIEYLDHGTLYDSEYEAAVKALDAAQVKAALKAILDSGNLVEVVITPDGAAEKE
ncbi:MAG: insulinase family protein [Bacteroidales bacterium]|nr:insulinase family protein [Bacteroidales bacterium]